MYLKDYRIFRANNSGNGSAASFQFVPDKQSLFLTFAKQGENDSNGNATFTWKDKESCIVMKLGENDIGELLACLSGMKGYAGGLKNGNPTGLYHQNANGNVCLQFKYLDGNDKFPEGKYEMSVSQKVGDAPLKKAIIYVSFGEAIRLKGLLETVKSKIYSWDSVVVSS